MKPRFYDAEGNEVSVLQWAKQFEAMPPVAQQLVAGKVFVSTIFVGFDRRFPLPEHGPPMTWETRVFRTGMEDVDSQSYGSREEALAGHAAMVQKWTDVIALEEAAR